MKVNGACELKSIRIDTVEEVSKKMLLDENSEEIARLFKLLGDYNRIRILNALECTDELCVCELSLLLDMSQSSISHQLRILRANNIVKYRKEDKRTFYSLKNDEISKLIDEASKI